MPTYEHITSPAAAIACAETGHFYPSTMAGDRGINFVHPTLGLIGNNALSLGAKLICDWGGNTIQGAPPFNAAGYLGQAMYGMPGNLYIDPHPRAFLPIGTVNNLAIVSIDFYSATELESFVYNQLVSRKQSWWDRLTRKKITVSDTAIENAANALKIKYIKVNIPLQVG